MQDEYNNEIICKIEPYSEREGKDPFDYESIIFDLDTGISALSSQADTLDYIVAAASGIACSLLDILWVGEIDLENAREKASKKIDKFVVDVAKKRGYTGDTLKGAVEFLEKNHPLASDGALKSFGGPSKHHFNDFAHHPTIVGLIFSLLTQFTERAYGTNEFGVFVFPPPEVHNHIGDTISQKIIYGTLGWFLHLVSDMAGSSRTAGNSGGTGIPGPILSLAEEFASLPIIRNLKVGDDSTHAFLEKLFDGSLLCRKDAQGNVIDDSKVKFDLRGELGFVNEMAKQAVPVIANECFVRVFYFMRRLLGEMKKHKVANWDDLKKISWDEVKPYDSPTLTRMLTISSMIFTTIDVGEALTKPDKLWVSINYVGVCRFAIAIGGEISWGLKRRNLVALKNMYETIKEETFRREDAERYAYLYEELKLRLGRFDFSLEQYVILRNMCYHKVMNDVHNTTSAKIKALKREWLEKWKAYMEAGFESHTEVTGAKLKWYSLDELFQHIEANNPEQGCWYRILLLEAMTFKPYYAFEEEADAKGKTIPTKKYKFLGVVPLQFDFAQGDAFLDAVFTGKHCPEGYVSRLRKCYSKCVNELNRLPKKVIGTATAAVVSMGVFATLGFFFAPGIAVALVGAKFAGLSGAALTSASLASLGGGAIAAGGAGIAGGTAVVVGGGAALGLGAGAAIGGASQKLSATMQRVVAMDGEINPIKRVAKLVTAVREIFIEDNANLEQAQNVHEVYVAQIRDLERYIVVLKLMQESAVGNAKKLYAQRIREVKSIIEIMRSSANMMAKAIALAHPQLEAPSKEHTSLLDDPDSEANDEIT